MRNRDSRATGEVRIAVDTGGTFTDFVTMKDGKTGIAKVQSTPDDPARAVLSGMKELPEGPEATRVIHGSTVATNALLEGKGARTALVTTRGFEDVIEIGRQTRSRIYDIMVDRPAPLVRGPDRYGVGERVGPFGELEKAVDPDEVAAIAGELREKGIEAVAVCFINSYANPVNERAVEEILKNAGGWPLSVSCRVLPEYREYERCSTTVVNAYVSVLMAEYLGRLGREIGAGTLRIMQSNGGFISAGRAADEPVRTILSGPAGGVIGALETGKLSGFRDIISFDMGGTSTDVCLCRGGVNTTTEAEMGGYPVRVPMMDIHTVGAGGGSIAWVDRGGALRVGPMSAGADPGPICYGTGDRLTVTDAHLYLGRLEEKWFLDGEISLDRDRVSAAVERLAAEIGKDPRDTAMGIIEVANINMERAIRVISLERGHDPGDFTLVTFGGAGALHACDIADDLSISTILIPENPGTLSAIGMLMTDVVTDHSASVLVSWEEWQGDLSEEIFRGLEKKASEEMAGEVGPEGAFSLLRSLDMRYVGQSYELNVTVSERGFLELFHGLHEARYGYSDPGKPVEVAAARVRGVGSLSRPVMQGEEFAGEDPSRARIGERETFFRSGPRTTGIYRREGLKPGNRAAGPALLVEYSATSLIPPGYEAGVDAHRNLVLRKQG